ncbi:hypothetical protein ACEK07_04365 [Alcanivoracaceae bacterium MT1]
MTLALRMGRTLSELEETMPEREFQLWQAFDAISPIGDIRRDLYDAKTAAAVLLSRGIKVPLTDLLIPWDGVPEGDDDQEQELTEDGRPALTPAVMQQFGAKRHSRN